MAIQPNIWVECLTQPSNAHAGHTLLGGSSDCQLQEFTAERQDAAIPRVIVARNIGAHSIDDGRGRLWEVPGCQISELNKIWMERSWLSTLPVHLDYSTRAGGAQSSGPDR